MLYEQYGDLRILERAYPGDEAMDRTYARVPQGRPDAEGPVRRLVRAAGIPKLIHSEDPARRTEGTFIATAYLLRNAAADGALRQAAGQAGGRGRGYESLAARCAARPSERNIFDSANGIYTQRHADVQPVCRWRSGWRRQADRQRVFENLTRKIEQESKGHIGVGLIGRAVADAHALRQRPRRRSL